MKTKLILLCRIQFLCLVLIATSLHAQTPALGFNNNRIAVTSDGNSEPDNHPEAQFPKGDPDDIGATPASLAIIAKLGLQDKLVHYSYNNFVGAPAGPDNTNKMKISADGAISRWNFDGNKFYDVTKEINAARTSLASEMSKSTASDPLYVILAGLSEFLYQAVEEVVNNGNINALSHVYLISHSGFNENHKRRNAHHTWDQTQSLSGNRIQYKKIQDQNNCGNPNQLWCSGNSNYTPYNWMNTSNDESIKWMYSRMKASGLADISDCGMMYYLLWGDANGNPSKFKNFLGDGIDTDGGGGDNNPPIVSFSDPVNNESFIAPANIEVTVNANDSDGSISNVKLYINDDFIRQENSAPYNWINDAKLKDLNVGSYILKAEATDNEGAKSTNTITFVVKDDNGGNTQTPFKTHSIPGTIQAEDYDIGGQGIAYNDMDISNNGGQGRVNEGVDLESTTDIGGGINVGWIASGEWLEYTIANVQSGTYDISFRISSIEDNAKTITATLGAKNLGSVNVPNTSGWQSWKEVKLNAVNITNNDANQILRLDLNKGYNVNWIKFEKTSDGGDTQTAYKDHDIPGVIQAEDYDNGGQGIAYNDTGADNNGGEGRTDQGVDIENTTDVGGGTNVGWINNGEWLEYTLDAISSGTYDIVFRVASTNGNTKSITAKLGAKNLGSVNVPNTNGWQSWTNIKIDAVDVSSSSSDVLRLDFSGGAFNVNWIEFKKTTTDNDNNCIVTEKDGLLIMETENISLQGQWEKVEDVKAHGGAYIHYTGPNHYNDVLNEETIEVKFKIINPGRYTVKWLMRQPSEVEGDKSNDAWINFPDAKQYGGAQLISGFNKFVGRSKESFGMNGQLDLHGNQPWMGVQFEAPGVYTLQLSARSELLQLDRIVLYKEMNFDTAVQTSQNMEASDCLLDDKDFDDEKNKNATSLSLYPNPLKGNILSFEIAGGTGVNELRVFNELGMLIARKNLGIISEEKLVSLDVNELNLHVNGVYFVKLVSDRKMKSAKLIYLKN